VKRLPRAIPLIALLAAIAAAAHTANAQSMTTYLPGTIQWVNAPAALRPGAQMAVVKGDPTQTGLFTMRLRFPANYRVDPHSHTADEHITVISGALFLGMGETFDRQKGKKLPVGTFNWMTAGTRHFAWTEQETEIQLHGIGPWVVNYVNPADDPRRP
jgi:quercetin dioxygenase-like cupin family protein